MSNTSEQQHHLIPYKIISSAKFPIVLAKSTLEENVEYVIKAFVEEDDSSCLSFIREKKLLSSLKHPNIIKYIPGSSFKVHNLSKETKFIMMEYAPHGDFFSLVINDQLKSEKLIRTYFHQLIEGIEYIHNQGMAHLDLKLENLLLGKDLHLKIADFDVAQYIEDEDLVSQGSVNYRAPELIEGTCTNYQAADIFSAGICLFTMISKIFPFVEEGDENQLKFQSYEEFLLNNDSYWKGIERISKKKSLFSESLRELLNGIWTEDANERLSLEEIKASKWYNQPIYTMEELQEILIQKVPNK